MKKILFKFNFMHMCFLGIAAFFFSTMAMAVGEGQVFLDRGYHNIRSGKASDAAVDFREAIVRFNPILEESPYHADIEQYGEAIVGCGLAHEGLGNRQEAIDLFQRAIVFL